MSDKRATSHPNNNDSNSSPSKATTLLGRHFLLVVLGTTMSFSLFGTYRLQKAVLVSNGVFDAAMHRHRKEAEYDAFFAPQVSSKEEPQQSSSRISRELIHQDTTIHNQIPEQHPPLITPHNPKIRSWGCEPLTETPFIFIHIGKSGGGNIKARLATAPIHNNNWTRAGPLGELSHAFQIQKQDNSFLPAAFATSQFPNYRPSYNTTEPQDTPEDWATYEGTLPCAAETPLGQALACPLLRLPSLVQQACHDENEDSQQCNLVYAGHNYIGSELHWLPNNYLAQWWKSSKHREDDSEQDVLYDAFLHRLDEWTSSDQAHCWLAPEKNRTGHIQRHYRSNYAQCVRPREGEFDRLAQEAMPSLVIDWSPLYASLPVLRVTVLREPMAWLVSKFFWHSNVPGYWRGISGKRHYNLTTCDNSDRAIEGSDEHLDVVVDWISFAALQYIYYLCGEDCVVRMHHGHMTLDEAEIQARHNLQHSFAVVGLLEELPSFYQMVTARTHYLDTNLRPPIRMDKNHESQVRGSVQDSLQRCKDLFTATYQRSNGFVRAVTARSPELAALRRLYRVGVAVSHAQRDELEACGSLSMALQQTEDA